MINLGEKRDVVLYGIAFLATLLFVFVGYFLVSTPALKSLVWMGWVCSVLSILFFTKKGQAAYVFSKEAKLELQKVVWPTRQETVQVTLIVVSVVLVSGFLLWLVDAGMMWVIGKITHLG